LSGCFENDPEDRAREKELNEYLDRTYGGDDDDEPDDLDFIEAVREKERDDKMEAEYE